MCYVPWLACSRHELRILAAQMIVGDLCHRPGAGTKPAVGRFRVLDFFKVDQVLEASEPIREDVKRKLDAAFSRVSA